MASQRDIDRRNDANLLTPLLVMALVIAAGVLFCALTGHALTHALAAAQTAGSHSSIRLCGKTQVKAVITGFLVRKQRCSCGKGGEPIRAQIVAPWT